MTPDPILVRLIRMIAWLNGVHTLDHMIRGDFHWPIDGQSIAFVMIIGAIYLVIGMGLWLFRKGGVGPAFWTMIGSAGLMLGCLSHFGPFTDQPLHVIYGTYHKAAAGALAVLCLLLLMGVVLAATLYSGYRWSRQRRGPLSLPVPR